MAKSWCVKTEKHQKSKLYISFRKKTFKIQTLDSQSQHKIVAFQKPKNFL